MEIRKGIQAVAIGFLLSTVAVPVMSAEDRTELYEENEKARLLVVRLTGPTTEGAGILFHVDEQFAYGITAKHVLYQQGKVVQDLKAYFQAWPAKQFSAEHYKLHPQEDLAVFRVDLRPLGISRGEILGNIPFDMLGTSTNLDPGDELSSMGHATAGAWITPKEWVRFARKEPNTNAFLFEYACPQGHSGGAVFDKDWLLVGMMIDEERPYCRALGIDYILKTVQGWKLDIDLRPPPSPSERGPKKTGDITVAVVDFDNRSAKDLPNLGAVAQDITSSSLYTLPGVVLVTRDRLDQVRQEVKLPDSVQTGTGISRVGKLLNADALVTGSILRYDVERRVFKGYDTSALMDIFRMEISLQILDVATGRVRFSKTFPVERIKQYPKETSAPSEPIDLTSELLTALVNSAQRDLESALMQIASGLTANQFIKVHVTSRPAGADVLLGGIFIAKTPCDLTVLPGAIHDLQIEMPGYESYIRRVKVEPGLKLDVNLVSKLR